MEIPPASPPEKVSVFQLVLVVLSIVVLIALATDAILPLPPEISTIVQTLDLVVCALFFANFLLRFRRAPNKASFMRWGWIGLLGCIPNIDALRVALLVPLLGVINQLRGGRLLDRVLLVIRENKPKSALASALLTTLVLITLASIAILIAEDGPEANIRTAEDAIWWSVTTMTTVGYGDKYPTTTEGRAVAMAVMFAGVGLFGTLSGLVASLFLGPPREHTVQMKEILERLEALDAKLATLEKSRNDSASSP